MTRVGSTPDIDRYLSIRSARDGSVTADGARLAFVSDLSGTPQAWVVPLGAGWPTELTVGEDRVQAVLASPTDPTALVVGRDAGGDERTRLLCLRLDGRGERPLAAAPDVIHRPGRFDPDGRWLYYTANDRNGVDFDLHRVPLEGGASERVAVLDGWNVVAGVAPEGDRVLVSHLRGLLDGDVWLVDVERGAWEVLGEVGGTEPVVNDPAGFATRGWWARSDRAADVVQAGLLLPDGQWRPVTGHRWEADGLAVGDDVVACSENVDGVSRLSLLDALTGAVRRRVALPDGVVEDLRVTGRRISFTFSSAVHPPDVWVADADTGQASAVTRSSTAGLDPATFVAPDVHRVEGHDGLELPVLSYRSPEPIRPPTVIWVHGGPEAQSRPAFNAVFQHWIACGWAVVAPNVRGSTGYGRRYASLDDGRRRLDAVADLVAVGEWVRARPDLGDRVALAGGSYGGYLTLLALAARPDLWAAAVSIVGMANLVTFLEQTGDYRRALREREYGSLSDDRDFLVEASPLTHVDRIAAPLLLIHGANDPRVPVAEAEQIHEAMRARGRRSTLLVFDDEGHGIVKRSNRRVAYGRVQAFLAEHLTG